MAKHLWEVEHDYYCNEANYYSNECHEVYESWKEFIDAEGDNDMDLNLLFRWDWDVSESGKHLLQMFWVGQRKGLFRCTEVQVKPEDEPKVIKFLKPRLEHLMKLWTPLNIATQASED